MKIIITIDMFSGRENPSREMEGEEARQALRQLRPARPLGAESPPEPPLILGYRGLVIEQLEGRSQSLPARFRLVDGALYGPDLAAIATDPTLEAAICDADGRVPEQVRKRARELRANYEWQPPPLRPRKGCARGPIYEPEWWNEDWVRTGNNNCYNYATNYRTDTSAQPGEAAGIRELPEINCEFVRDGALRDGLIDSPDADNRCPEEGHLVALVISPGHDYHWYRKGRDGLWTHKIGGLPVTNVDNAGHLISDPREAAREPYEDWCCFMVARHGHFKIK